MTSRLRVRELSEAIRIEQRELVAIDNNLSKEKGNYSPRDQT